MFTLLGLFAFSLSAAEKTPLTAVRIEGLTGLSEEEVITRLGGRLDFVTSRPPSRSRADDADFLVSRLLEKEGYSDVTISWKIPADRKSIILRVSSGPRLTIKDVEIQGAPEEDADIMKQYFTGKSLLGGETEVPYLPDKVEKASQSAITYLKAQGYWKAKGNLGPPAINIESRTVDLSVDANPGPLHKIVSLDLDGKLIPEIPKLPKQLERFLGRTSSAATLREIRDGTTAAMRDKGYQFANSTLEADHRNGETRLNLILEPGKRYRLRQAQITGAEGTDISRVQKLFKRSSGKPYDENKIKKLRNSLLSTGAFDAVNRDREIDEDARSIDVTLHLKEGKPKGISYYLGAGSIEGFIVGASYYNRNFLSKLYNYNIAAEYSGIGFLGQVSVTDPFVLGYDLRATPRAFALTRTYDEYRKLEVGFGLNVSTELTDRQILELDTQFSYATVEPEDLPASALGSTDYLLTSLGATWYYDSRDSKASPTKGLYARVRAELGAVAAETPNAFLRLNGQLSYHLPINDKSRLGLNLRTGILSPADGDELPIDLRYFLGGADSVRSFPFRELGPNINGTARGGEAFWYANAEYIRKLAGPVYGVVFFDAGSLDESALAWPSFDPKLAAGLGLRIDLPIGPVRLEYGRSLNPAPEDPAGAFHFAIGASF
ncbi:MAG: BamA/OMP85 family outer membrane protein [Roseibacillus sp.]